jgi:hypothetical protein
MFLCHEHAAELHALGPAELVVDIAIAADCGSPGECALLGRPEPE